jgi:aryl-alcohol dehydrogenase-like predicted oxidoreductase
MLRDQPRFVEHYAANQRVVDLVREVGAETGATPAQVALAWLWAQGVELGLPVVPIPGTRSAQRVSENADAVALRLTTDQKRRLDGAAELVRGGRNLTFASTDWISAGRE